MDVYSQPMEIIKNIKVPTGNILIGQGNKGPIEFLSIGDYGKEKNLKADFLGLSKEINGVPHGDLLPLEDKWVITISTQYGCNMGCRFCLLEDAPILMSDYSYKNIKDIQLGDMVLGNSITTSNNIVTNYATRYTEQTEVIGLIKRNYNGIIYKIKTKNEQTIICTEEHLLAVFNTIKRTKFISANKIKIGDKIIVCNKINNENYLNNNWKLGWMYGFYLGDGGYGVTKSGPRIYPGQKYKYILEFFKNNLNEIGIKSSNIYEVKSKLNGKEFLNYRFYFQCNQATNFLKICEKNKNDINFKNGCLAGFWDAEGFSFVNNKCVRVCNNDIKKINYMEQLYNEFGYTCSRYKNNNGCITLNVHMNRDKFISEFTPIHHKKLYLQSSRTKKMSFLSEVGEILKISYKGLVYNIETKNHTYFANNILNHNCDVPKVGAGHNATQEDMIKQVIEGMKLHPEVKYTKRLNIHFARMGEPTFNPDVLFATRWLKKHMSNTSQWLKNNSTRVDLFHPVVSTMMPKNNKWLKHFLYSWMEIKNDLLKGEAGLQISLNSTDEAQRKEMFNNNACSLKQIYGIMNELPKPYGRKITLNIALNDTYIIDPDILFKYFEPKYYLIKITPLHKTNTCIENKLQTSNGYDKYYPYKECEEKLKKAGYDVIVFVPSKEEDESRITCGNAILADKENT